MKIIRLLSLFTFLFCLSQVSAQNCGIDFFELRLNPCNGNQFSINYDFEFDFEQVPSSKYSLFIDGQKIDDYFYHDRDVTVVLDGSISRAITVRIQDSTDPTCFAEEEFEFTDCASGNCTMELINYKVQSCNGDGTFDIRNIQVNYSGGETLLNLYGNGKFITQEFYTPGDSFFIISFPKNWINDTETLTISVSDDPSCSVTATIPTSDACTGCNLYNIEVDVFDCSNGEFYLTVDFGVHNASGGFTLGDGEGIIGVFSYDELPVTVGPLEANTDKYYDIFVLDNTSSFCFTSYELGYVVCKNVTCDIYDVTTTLSCETEQSYNILLDFEYDNAGANPNFSITLNGENVGVYSASQLPVSIEDITAIQAGSDVIVICVDGDPACCETVSIQRPNCSCEISALTLQNTSCNDDNTYNAAFNYQASLGAGDEFTVYINDVEFATVTNAQGLIEVDNIAFSQLPTNVIRICSVEDPSCCASLLYTQPNCQNCIGLDITVNPCSGLLFSIVIAADYNGDDDDFLVVEINGENKGAFPYSLFPVTINGLSGDGTTEHTVVVRTLDSSCSGTEDLGVTDCTTSVVEGVVNGKINALLLNSDLILNYAIQGTEQVDLTLYDINGKIILQKDKMILSGRNTENIYVSNLAGGIYIVRLAGDKFVYVNKLMAR